MFKVTNSFLNSVNERSGPARVLPGDIVRQMAEIVQNLEYSEVAVQRCSVLWCPTIIAHRSSCLIKVGHHRYTQNVNGQQGSV